jgi:hypothetical protein
MAVALIAAAAIQFTLLFLLRHHMERGNWGLLLFVATMAVLPLGLTLWFAVAAHYDRRGWWKIPLVLWPVGFVALVPGAAVHDAPEPPPPEIAMPAPVSNYWRAGASIAGATRTVAQRSRDRIAAPAQPAAGDMAVIDRIGLAFATQMASDGSDYEAALAAAGYSATLLSPTVRSRADLAAERRRVAAVLSLIADFEARYEARIEAVERQLGQAPISDEARAAVLGGFRAAVRLTRDRARQIWQLERDIAQAHRGMIEVLAQSRWTRDGERLVFPSTVDQARFETRLGDVRAARDDQAAWRDEMQETIEAVADGSMR